VRNYGKLVFFRRNWLSRIEFELAVGAPRNYGKLADHGNLTFHRRQEIPCDRPPPA
jgi:hypothetical protein